MPEGLLPIVCKSNPNSNKTSGATLYDAPFAQSKVTWFDCNLSIYQHFVLEPQNIYL